MEKKIKKNEGEENEEEEDIENVVQEEEKEGYEEEKVNEDEEKIKAFLLFKNKTILIFTNTYFFLIDIKLLKIKK